MTSMGACVRTSETSGVRDEVANPITRRMLVLFELNRIEPAAIERNIQVALI